MRRYKDVFGALLALAFSLPAWVYPFGNDQGLHWYIGRRWLDGELPFVSAISSKPIGMFVVHALTTAVLGEATWAIRVSEALTVLLIGFVVALAARPTNEALADGELGLGALLFAGLYYTFFDYWDTAHPELWEGGFVLAAWVVACRAGNPWQRDAGAGALCTLAFMFKYPAALPGVAVAAMCALRAIRERAPGQLHTAVVRAGLRFVAGALPVVFAVVLPFAMAGKLGPMWEVLYDFILLYRERARPAPGIPKWLRIEQGGGLVLLAALVGACAIAYHRGRRDGRAVSHGLWLIALCTLALGSVIIQARYFGYHFVVITPFCAVLCAYGLVAARERLAVPWTTFAAVTSLLVIAAAIGPRWRGKTTTYGKHAQLTWRYLDGSLERESYLAHYQHARLENPRELERVAAILLASKQPKDTLCTRGFIAPLYQMTGMRCTSRHIVEDIVGAGLPGWRKEYEAALRKNPPTFMVSFTDRPRDLRRLERDGYHRLGSVHLFAVYGRRRRTGASPGS